MLYTLMFAAMAFSNYVKVGAWGLQLSGLGFLGSGLTVWSLGFRELGFRV